MHNKHIWKGEEGKGEGRRRKEEREVEAGKEGRQEGICNKVQFV